jgi:hypothetical protein
MSSLVAQPYITLPDYNTVEFSSKNEILLSQNSAVKKYERNQHGKAIAR